MPSQRDYWDGMAKHGADASVIDPEDRHGNKNAYIKYVRDTVLDDFASRLSKPSTILDFGCGTGNIGALFARHGHNAVGTDISLELLRMARTRCGSSNTTFLCYDGNKLPLKDNYFDGVVTYGVLNYIIDDTHLAKVLNELFRVLKPGGQFVAIEQTARHSRITDGGMKRQNTVGAFEHAFREAGFFIGDIRTIRHGHFPFIYLIRYGAMPRKLFTIVRLLEGFYGKLFNRPLFDYTDTVFQLRKP